MLMEDNSKCFLDNNKTLAKIHISKSCKQYTPRQISLDNTITYLQNNQNIPNKRNTKQF